MTGGLAPARAVALLLPAALLAGAWGFQLIGHIPPCEMCHWQRWPHYAALVLALAAFATRGTAASRALVLLAGIAILASGAVGVLHAGVEYRWWTGPTRCSSPTFAADADPLRAMLAAPLIRCDTAAWTLGGVSLAGFNALFSLLGGLFVVMMCLKPAR